MKVNKRGFTLVELLAVIVILAILILLALPTVLKIMDKAKKDAFKTEALSILKAAETKYAAEGKGVIEGACIEYNETDDSLKEYIKYKSDYTAVIFAYDDPDDSSDDLEFAINIKNLSYLLKELTKANANTKTADELTFDNDAETNFICIDPAEQ